MPIVSRIAGAHAMARHQGATKEILLFPVNHLIFSCCFSRVIWDKKITPKLPLKVKYLTYININIRYHICQRFIYCKTYFKSFIDNCIIMFVTIFQRAQRRTLLFLTPNMRKALNLQWISCSHCFILFAKPLSPNLKT